MTFAAFTSAMVVRQGSSMDWRHFVLPSVLYLNTAILLASSVTLEFARARVRMFERGLQSRRGISLLWLYVTLGLGLLFVAGQYAGVAQAEVGRTVPGDQSQQLVFLSVHRHPCSSRARGTCRTDFGDLAFQQTVPNSAPEHAQHGFVLLALHGCAMDLPSAVAVDTNLTRHWEETL